VVGRNFEAETVAELELDHVGYVVCHNPSLYVVEDVIEGIAVVVVETDVESGMMDEINMVADVNSIVVVGMMVIVFCPPAVTVTVAAAGVIITTDISVVS
jgi:hypothetical protein